MTGSTPQLSRLQRFVVAGRLRYWIISSWALALATVIPIVWVAVWYGVTMVSGVLRGLVDQRRDRLPAGSATAVATLACLAWAAAPLIAWFFGGSHGDTLAAVLLCAGYFLVFTQMRAAPREAIVVSSPYSVATAIILVDMVGEPEFWTVLATLPILAIALLIKVLITQLKDRELSAVADRQRELIAELEQARDRAHAASEAKSNFLAVISHELRTPMNGVLGAAQLLDHDGLTARDRDYVRIIRGSGEGLLDLLNDLLDVSKMEAGKLELHPRPIETRDFQARLVGPCQTQAEAKGLELIVDCASCLPPRILADPVRLGQVVQNLLSNAIKFTEEGRVTLRIGCHTDGGATRLSFCVEDTGPGISAEGQAQLFQPFQQLDDSSTRRFGGTGLGLTIARRIALQMGGDVEVRSTPGVGSVFTFTALVEPLGDIEAAPSAAPGEDGGDGRLRVLVVEDHPVNRMIIEAWLGAQGHAVATANDGEDGLAAARQEGFDLILMDVNMPGMDGLTATRQIRAHPGPNADTPVVILSASARPQDHEVGLAAGADAYLNKPIDFGALAEMVSRLPVLRRPGAAAA
ncbi:ATP-binding protein [Brevundimonas sp. GCM10030266]|uniref:ATP-binding protein n=1 Tax=Brevundimonas sp. GCM10030266 TaxID=3273386 RepID=UPI0036233550